MVSCTGMLLLSGSEYGMPTSSVPARALSTAWAAVEVSPRETDGSVGKAVTGAAAKLNAR